MSLDQLFGRSGNATIASTLVLCAAFGCGSSNAPSTTGTGGSGAAPPIGTMSTTPTSPTTVGAGTSTTSTTSTAAPPVAGSHAPTVTATAGASGAAGLGAAGVGAAIDTDAGVEPPTNDGTNPGATRADCPAQAYVSNSGSDSMSIIDTNTNKVIKTVKTGTAPVNPTFTPDRRHVYVSDSQADTITIIDVATFETSTIPAGGAHPSGLAFSPDGDTLYVSHFSDDFTSPGFVISIKLSTSEVSTPIPMGADPERVALTPGGDHLYVNNLLDGTMAVVDTAAHKVSAMLTLGDLPFNPVMAPDGSVVYVGVMSADHIAVIDTSTNQVMRTIPADSPNGMSFSSDQQSFFVSNALSGTVEQVSLTMDKILKTQDVGGLPGNLSVLPDGKHAYMVRPDGSTVEVLDTSTLMITETITVESGPSVVTICRDLSKPM